MTFFLGKMVRGALNGANTVVIFFSSNNIDNGYLVDATPSIFVDGSF